MDSAEPTQKECDSGATTVAASAAPTMPRVPFVGRLHLYIPHPTKSFPFLHYPSPAPSSAATAVDTSFTPPPTPPSPCKSEQHLEEVEPIEDIAEESEEAEEEEEKKIEDVEDVVEVKEEEEAGEEEEEQAQPEEAAAMEEDASTSSSTLWERKESTEKFSKANSGPVMASNSVEYVALYFSFLFLLAEGFLRVITLALRKSSFLLSSAFLFGVTSNARFVAERLL